MRQLPRKTDPRVDLDVLLGFKPITVIPAGPSSTAQPPALPVVALTVDDASTRGELSAILAGQGFHVGGAEAEPRADVVIVDGKDTVGATIASLRIRARTDAAIVCVVPRDATGSVAEAHAAGAFACIAHPFVGSAVVGLVRSAAIASTARIRVADLANQLDLQSHLASIGRMSAGLSHEIANPLTVASGSVDFLREETSRLIESERLLRLITTAPCEQREQLLHTARAHLAGARDPNEVYGAFADATNGFERIEALLRNLRVLIGQGVVREQSVDLMKLVRDVRRWAAEALHDVTVEEEGAPLVVRADPNLLGQIVLNLATNAANAAKSLSSARVRFHVYASGPNEAVISVRDNGPGIPAEMQAKIFEPFFTTRRGRGGTGLGLSLCRELARQIGADISFWSVQGRGSCFRVRLPLTGPTQGPANGPPRSA